MDKQKEIEKLEETIGDSVGLKYEGEQFPYTLRTQKYLAKELVSKGYGDVRAAVKEFAESIKMAFYYEFDELIPSIMADKIDELVKEVCGDD